MQSLKSYYKHSNILDESEGSICHLCGISRKGGGLKQGPCYRAGVWCIEPCRACSKLCFLVKIYEKIIWVTKYPKNIVFRSKNTQNKRLVPDHYFFSWCGTAPFTLNNYRFYGFFSLKLC